MDPGTEESSPTVDGQFIVSLSRTAAQAWRFDFRLAPGRVPPSPADAKSGFLVLTASSDRDPPWRQFEWKAEITAQDGQYSETFRLDYCAPLEEACPPPAN